MATETIRRLVADLKAVTAEHDDPCEIVTRVADLTRPLAEDTSWIEPRFLEGDAAQGFGVTVLHEAPDHGLLVETVCWLPGGGVAPHDHQTWGVVIGLRGTERNVSWRRLDDGTREGHAEITPDEDIVVGPGDCVCLRPDDIHSVRNEGTEPSLSLHIYGKNLAHLARSEFDPQARTRRPCPRRERKR